MQTEQKIKLLKFKMIPNGIVSYAILYSDKVHGSGRAITISNN